MTDYSRTQILSGPRRTHVAYPQPDDLAATVWRFMDLAKLVSLLERRELFLPSVEILGDPHEGSMPLPSAEARDAMFEEAEKLLEGAEPKEIRKLLGEAMNSNKRFMERLRRFTYVSCWHMNEHESEAMWRLYCTGRSGVAV